MKKIFFIIYILILFSTSANCEIFTGGVTKVGQNESNRVLDSQSKQPVEFAKISMPQKQFHTYTDQNGNFELPNIKITAPTILNVEKEGYRPFSITINNNQSLNSPMKIEIAKSTPMDIAIDNDILHLGDNSFSKNSANAFDFKLKSCGPSYTRDFIMTKNAKHCANYLIFGSVVGLDTKLAHALGQNKIKSGAYSSPAEVFFNGQKIGELTINGDGERIKIPNSLIKADDKNQITVKTGQNIMASDHIDYDDIEIMNLSILSE